MDQVTKHFDVVVEKATDAAYDARFIMSAATPDRVKDTIDPAAYDKATKANKLIALWQHDSTQPIGFWENLRVEKDALIGDLKVAGTNLGMMIKELLAIGTPLGASIGFRGKGEANKHGGIHFKELELLECSVVSVPAHARAMQIAKSFGVSLDDQPVVTERDAIQRKADAALQSSLNVLRK